jgi:phosphatidylglycerophosphate synthase
MAQRLDRRPIAAREHRWSRATAAWLARRGISPNAISIFGLICGMGAGAMFAASLWLPESARGLWLLGSLLVQLRLAANMFDGMVALWRGATSPLGELYNEIPDRISDSAVLVGLGIAGGSWGLGCLAALAAMLTAYVRAVGKGAGAASEFCGPMAKQQRMFLVTLAALWFALTPGSWQQGAAGRQGILVLLGVIALGAAATALRRLHRIAGSLRQGG